MKMKCLYCNGELNVTQSVFHADRKGIHLTIDRLKGYKCEKCGEILVATPEMNLIQKTLSELEEAIEKQVA
ncbi:MAG TPA: YgiT-type zinc finger protein [Caldithrix sp.]|nr:YgiT-type zinc finger protein [Caldithrix sp.]